MIGATGLKIPDSLGRWGALRQGLAECCKKQVPVAVAAKNNSATGIGNSDCGGKGGVGGGSAQSDGTERR